jgi:hypothetical protein
MVEKIEYTKDPDNCQEVVAFIGDYGDYENGQAGCSRLVPFVDHEGDRACADWGDAIERREDGLHLVQRPRSIRRTLGLSEHERTN